MILIESTLHLAQELAERVARKAGEVAKANFDRLTSVIEKDAYGDIVTEVDHEAERIICDEIADVFPDHEIHSLSGKRGKL